MEFQILISHIEHSGVLIYIICHLSLITVFVMEWISICLVTCYCLTNFVWFSGRGRSFEWSATSIAKFGTTFYFILDLFLGYDFFLSIYIFTFSRETTVYFLFYKYFLFHLLYCFLARSVALVEMNRIILLNYKNKYVILVLSYSFFLVA